MDILETIVKAKKKELSSGRKPFEGAFSGREKLSLKSALRGSSVGIIAEFKRKSPSKGWIHEDISPEDVVPLYARNGAAALSILTDREFFGGDIEYISRMRPLVDIPILRKDFIIDSVQLREAESAGADAVLLIAACLSPKECSRLSREAHSLGLEVLLEVHHPEELEYFTSEIDVVGVNNRNLGSFVTDVENSFRMAPLLSEAMASKGNADAVMISESGISDPSTVRELRKVGYRGFLMGENFMKTSSPGESLGKFIASV